MSEPNSISASDNADSVGSLDKLATSQPGKRVVVESMHSDCSEVHTQQLLNDRIDYLPCRGGMHRYTWQGVPRSADVVLNHRILDVQCAGEVVGDEENRRAIGIGFIVFDARPIKCQRHGVAIVVDGAATPTAGGTRNRRISAIANRLVVREQAVVD